MTKSKKDISKLINEIIEYSIMHGEFSVKGDYKNANKLHAKISKITKELRHLGLSGLEAIAKLMTHNNQYVKVWAASNSLKYKTAEAEKTLENLINSKDIIVALDAKFILDFWRKNPSKFS